MKAPRTLRVILDCHGTPVESHDATKCTQAFARERRRELAQLYPEDAPFAVGTYELRPPGGKRAVITLTPKKKQ